MTSTTRTQNKYDHLLREHVRSTGDINHAIRLGVPRSTARGWVKSAPAEVITLDVVDMDNPKPGVRSRKPLRQAQITVEDVEGNPGWYKVDLKVRPHFKYMGSDITLSLVGKLDQK